MTNVSHTLQKLTSTVDSLESVGHSVAKISMDEEYHHTDEHLSVRFAVELPSPLPEEENTDGATFSATSAELKDDGSVVVSFQGEIARGDTDDMSAPGNQHSEISSTVPPHQNPEALQRVYEECDTFTEMTESLGTDVTPEAVRQQMLKHGIHQIPHSDSSEDDLDTDTDEPQTKSEASPGAEDGPSAETLDSSQIQSGALEPSEEVAPDGGLPSGLTVQELKEVVRSSQTLYEAEQQLGVDHDQARNLLKQFDLLEFVTGRLSMEGERNVTTEEIEQRFRSSGLIPP